MDAVSDHLDRPPADYGSDRFGYVELINAPAGVEPPPEMLENACPDCLPNLFLHHTESGWVRQVAHDDGCPTFEAMGQ